MQRRDTVLVVDDSPDSLNFLTDALEDGGLTVLVALNGTAALSLVDRVEPDIVLMDAVMPGIDGFETCRRLKAKKSFLDLPVIFMTGLSETEHIIHGFEAGGVDYVTKPIVPDELIARMQRHLGNARIARNARAALDATGRFLIAVDHTGRTVWCTPQAGALLTGEQGAGPVTLPGEVSRWLRDPATQEGAAVAPLSLRIGGRSLQVSYVGQVGTDEILLRLSSDEMADDTGRLQKRLGLTAREAEVLQWTGRGKSNREIAAILNVSHRTVNKHLDQIYTKLGVENRTAAAAIVVRALDGR
jgi:DNA-binding response OmpR family regulator/DNA-binding CsgD family transcriptional regulator